MAKRQRLAGRRVQMKPGVCFVCCCTDEYGCDEGCSWVDAEHTLCSACQERGFLFIEWMVARSSVLRPDAPIERVKGRASERRS